MRKTLRKYINLTVTFLDFQKNLRHGTFDRPLTPESRVPPAPSPTAHAAGARCAGWLRGHGARSGEVDHM